MASRIQKKNRTKKSPRNLAGAVLSLPALKYGDSRTFFIELANVDILLNISDPKISAHINKV